MNLEFPYQLTAFLDSEPTIGEPVYYGENGWYPQIALKRRFKLVDITEGQLMAKITDYCNSKKSFTITTGEIIQPDRMPVKVLEVKPQPELITFHLDLISSLGGAILSRYPERDGANYLPHITCEYDGKMILDEAKYSNKTFNIDRVFLLKDIEDENSVAYQSFELQ